jgi:hypothetical protein
VISVGVHYKLSVLLCELKVGGPRGRLCFTADFYLLLCHVWYLLYLQYRVAEPEIVCLRIRFAPTGPATGAVQRNKRIKGR